MTGDASATVDNGQTTVLGEDVVAARRIGIGGKEEKEVVHKDIVDFLQGEAKLGFWSETRCFFTIWIFITRLPAPTWVDLHPGYLMRGMSYFPLVGMLVGVVVSSVYDVGRTSFGLPSDIAACICQAVSFYMTICFHEDGLGDSADGIGGGWTKSQILKIMTDTRLGTYGCSALILYTITKIQLLACLGTSVWSLRSCQGAGPALVVGHMLSRLTAPWLIRQHDYVEEVGPKSPYYNFMMQAKHLVSWSRVAFATLSCAAVSWFSYGSTAAIILLISVLVASHISGAWGDYYLDGVMGDYLGATICLTELVVLITIVLLSDTSSSTSLANYISTTFEKISSNNEGLDGILAWIATDARMRCLIWCIALYAAMKVWCDNVGYSAEMLRAELPAANEEKEGLEHEQSPAADGGTPRQILNQQLKRKKGDHSSTVPVPGTFLERYNEMRAYIDSLAKPVGSLGALEDWSARLAALQQSAFPKIINVACVIFVGDHGVAAPKADGGEECSSYPQAVTQKILLALDHGMAGASILAKANGVTSMHVVDVGVIGKPSLKAEGGVVTTASYKLTNGTRNFCQDAAMTAEEVEQCLQEGRQTASKCALEDSGDMLVIGEVGIGNTTTASALLAALTGATSTELCDGGATLSRTVDQAVVDRKVDIVERGLKRHGKCQDNPSKALRCFGSAEICGMVGAILECSLLNKPVLVDGFIATTAAYIATLFSPSATRVLFLATKSSERGQSYAIEGIQKAAQEASLPPPSPPALQMSLRMGEASAALVAVPLLKSAAAVLDISTLNDVMSIPATPP